MDVNNFKSLEKSLPAQEAENNVCDLCPLTGGPKKYTYVEALDYVFDYIANHPNAFPVEVQQTLGDLHHDEMEIEKAMNGWAN